MYASRTISHATASPRRAGPKPQKTETITTVPINGV
jgi:hypothetical protein